MLGTMQHMGTGVHSNLCIGNPTVFGHKHSREPQTKALQWVDREVLGFSGLVWASERDLVD